MGMVIMRIIKKRLLLSYSAFLGLLLSCPALAETTQVTDESKTTINHSPTGDNMMHQKFDFLKSYAHEKNQDFDKDLDTLEKQIQDKNSNLHKNLEQLKTYTHDKKKDLNEEIEYLKTQVNDKNSDLYKKLNELETKAKDKNSDIYRELKHIKDIIESQPDQPNKPASLSK